MTDVEIAPADALAQLSFLVLGLIEEHAAASGLSLAQSRMLGILRDRTPLMSELGAHLGLDKSSVSGLVDRAAARGLVERVPSTEDRRAVHVRLTSAGRALISAAQTDYEADVADLLSPLNETQRETLVRLATRLLADRARPVEAARPVPRAGT